MSKAIEALSAEDRALMAAALGEIDAFATAEQGDMAETATQPGDLAAVATSGSYNDLTDRPDLGSAAGQSADAFATAAQGSAAEGAVQALTSLNDLIPGYSDRAGDARSLFSSAVTGDPIARPTIAAGEIVVDADVGTVLRISGADTDDISGYVDVAPRIAYPLYADQVYRLTYRVRRASDPTGEANSDVHLRFQSLNHNMASAGNARMGPAILPVETDGVITRTFLIGKAGAAESLDYPIPPSAIYGLPHVRVFGNGQQTDVISIGIENVTDKMRGGADLSQLAADLGADIAASNAAIDELDARLSGADDGLDGRIAEIEQAPGQAVVEKLRPATGDALLEFEDAGGFVMPFLRADGGLLTKMLDVNVAVDDGRWTLGDRFGHLLAAMGRQGVDLGGFRLTFDGGAWAIRSRAGNALLSHDGGSMVRLLDKLDVQLIEGNALEIVDKYGFCVRTIDASGVVQAPIAPAAINPLVDFRARLYNPLHSIYLRFVGDSITWGLRVTGNTTSTPSEHALSDARDGLDSLSWANKLRKWLAEIACHGQGFTAPAPGVGQYSRLFTVDPVGFTGFIYDPGKRSVPVDGSAFGTALIVERGGKSVSFDMTGDNITIIYAKQAVAAGAAFTVLVDGSVVASDSHYSSGAAAHQTLALTLPFGRHRVVIRNDSDLQDFHLEAVQHNRVLRVANDGLIGTNTKEWLPSGVLLPNAVKSDDTDVFVQLGTNDRSQSEPVLDVERTRRNLTTIASNLMARRKSVVLFAPPRGLDSVEGTGPYYNADVARAVRRVATTLRTGLIDQHAITTRMWIDGITFHGEIDKIHPDDVGHAAMFANAVDQIQQAL